MRMVERALRGNGERIGMVPGYNVPRTVDYIRRDGPKKKNNGRIDPPAMDP